MILRRCLSLAIAALLAAAPAAPAQSGNGLYEPFPEGIRKDRAVLFVERLGLGEGPRLTIDELERGLFLGSGARAELAATSPAEASSRAGVASEGGVDPVELLLVGAGALGAALVLLRRPRPRVASR